MAEIKKWAKPFDFFFGGGGGDLFFAQSWVNGLFLGQIIQNLSKL